MFDFQVDEADFEKLMANRRGRYKTHLDKALDDIRQRWQRQLITQQRNYRATGWAPLKKSYAEEKEREFPGQPILSRTGVMMRGYVNGITVDPQEGSVTINFPGGEGSPEYVRARAHQGVTGYPKGVTPRPFRLEPFRQIARDEIEKAVNKITKNE